MATTWANPGLFLYCLQTILKKIQIMAQNCTKTVSILKKIEQSHDNVLNFLFGTRTETPLLLTDGQVNSTEPTDVHLCSINTWLLMGKVRKQMIQNSIHGHWWSTG